MICCTSPKPDLKDLDLVEIVEWYSVGLQLGINEYALKTIEHDYSRLSDRKREMFSVWLRSGDNLTYSHLIKALTAAGEAKAAQGLQDKI